MEYNAGKKKPLYTSIGRRKKAVARAELIIQTILFLSSKLSGTNKILVNNRSVEDYFHFNVAHIYEALQPLKSITQLQLAQRFYLKLTITCIVITHGGGLSGQASAIKLAIAKSLFNAIKNKFIVSSFKHSGLLTCNNKCKERKKYGLKKARKASQYSKR